MEDPFRDADDVTVIMEVLLDIRGGVEYAVWLLEEGDGEDAEEDA